MKGLTGNDIRAPEPDAETIDQLCVEQPGVSRVDIYHCWKNASRYWSDIDHAKLNPEAPMLTASRDFFVRATLADFPEDKANFRYAEALLVDSCTLRAASKRLAIAVARVRTA